MEKELDIIIDQICNEAVIYGGKPDKRAFIHSILELCRKQVPGEKPTWDRKIGDVVSGHELGVEIENKGWNACRQEMLENLGRLGR